MDNELKERTLDDLAEEFVNDYVNTCDENRIKRNIFLCWTDDKILSGLSVRMKTYLSKRKINGVNIHYGDIVNQEGKYVIDVRYFLVGR